jgi:hypothetical protein
MWRTWSAFCLGAAICVSTPAALRADDKGEKHQIKGGIEGKVKMVDVENKKLTIVTDQGRTRTFTITNETMMVGPRGGKVQRQLRDPRFHEGFEVTVVAEGDVASEVHLGFARESSGEESAEHAKTAKKGAQPAAQPENTPQSRVSRKVPASAAPTAAKSGIKHADAKKLEDEDEEEIPGKVKSFDATRRVLVVTLLNGKSRSFFLAKEVPVHVKGKVSTRGLQDPALKTGASITIVTDERGRKVKELQLGQAALRKAG